MTAVRIALEAEPGSAKRARAAVQSVCDRNGIDAYLPVLCTSELVTNALLHASPPMELEVEALDNRLRVAVRDGGSADEVSPRNPVTENPTSGRGLAVVETVASRWGVETTAAGKVVWFEIDGEG